ncbi:MAG: 2-hydroxyacid dehydrogenase [Acetobacteraceae bacterium]|nr:2-hydroxyacid dehydrogenase [Acetobacteraceae bacterium]
MKPAVLGVGGLHPMFVKNIEEPFTLDIIADESEFDRVAEKAAEYRAIAATGESRVPASLLARLPNVGLISVFGVGYDGVDVPAARARGVAVTHTPNVLNDDVADLAIGLMLAASRKMVASDRFVRSGKWPEGRFPLGTKLSGRRLGILGLGRIGHAIAHRAEAFGMAISYAQRRRDEASPYDYYPSALELARAVDVLVAILPGGESTRGIINGPVLEALGPDGLFVNVARGSVVDEPALIEALGSGKLGAAGLDVFVDEPNVPPALFGMENVVLTPHIGSATSQTRQAMADLAFGNLQAHFAGTPLITPVPA